MTDHEIEAVAQAIAGARGVKPSVFDKAFASHNGLVKEHPGYDRGASMVGDALRDARAAIAALDAIRAQDDPRSTAMLEFAAEAQRRADDLAPTDDIKNRNDQVRAIKRIEWLKVRAAALNFGGADTKFLTRRLYEIALNIVASVADARGWGYIGESERHCSDYTQGARDCADEIAAAIRAQNLPEDWAQDRWRTMDDAPRDGQAFLAVVRGQVRLVSFCAASCFPVVGFCLADQGVEGYARCEPTRWRPLPAPPKGGE